jgi:hypothetical protein
MNAMRHGRAQEKLHCEKSRVWVAMALACAALMSSCAPTSLYHWDRYEESLKAMYIAPDETKAHSSLEATVTLAPETGGRVPPGAYAEYGFFLYRSGQRERAAEYFQKEADSFPESKPLMAKLIAKVRSQPPADAESLAAGGSAP